MRRAASLLPLVWVLGTTLFTVLAVASPVEWAVGEAFDLKIERVAERVQLGFMFGGFQFHEMACAPQPGVEISVCLQEFLPPEGLEAIERGWPIARIVFRHDQSAAGVGIPVGQYLAIAWLSDCVFRLGGRWFQPRTPLLILVRESDLSEPLPGGAGRWCILVPNDVALLWGAEEIPAAIQCRPASAPTLDREDVVIDLDVWNLIRLTVMAAPLGAHASLSVPTAEELYPDPGELTLHEALFSP